MVVNRLFIAKTLIFICTSTLIACEQPSNSDGDSETAALSAELTSSIQASSNGEGLSAFTMPDDGDYQNIPQDPNNEITAEKVTLGKMLFHETATATEGSSTDPDRIQTWSCASCHHLKAGFKAGVPQGIGEGGDGFGIDGEARVMALGFDSDSADIQPVASPAVLNITYQDVMLWDGAFGNTTAGVNTALPNVNAAGPDVIIANSFGLSGIETQMLAGTKVHRLDFGASSIMQTDASYSDLYDAAYPSPGDEGTIPANGTTVTQEALGAAKAIAAYERTIMANQSPYQKWLKGDKEAMSAQELRGALLFFGDASCVDCHRGPGLSSEVGASADQLFFAVGFSDFDTEDTQIHSTVPESVSKGRGGFTGNTEDEFKFKIPQLYNLIDANILGHGASFTSVRQVIEYKNTALPQQPLAVDNLDSRFTPLGLSEEEIDDLTQFIESGLYDSELIRYVPSSIPSGLCFPVADAVSMLDLGC